MRDYFHVGSIGLGQVPRLTVAVPSSMSFNVQLTSFHIRKLRAVSLQAHQGSQALFAIPSQ